MVQLMFKPQINFIEIPDVHLILNFSHSILSFQCYKIVFFMLKNFRVLIIYGLFAICFSFKIKVTWTE